MMFNRKLLFLFAWIPAISFATTSTTFDPSSLPTLATGLNAAKANQCARIMKSCIYPKNSAIPNESCVQHKVSINPSCSQLQGLAEKLETSPALLNLTSAPNGFMLVKKNYPADGQFQNYIVSPTGQIVDTRIDPREYNPVLKMQYPNKDLIISNIEPTQYKGKPNKPMTFTSTVKVSDGCVACTVLGYATTRYVFNKMGTLQAIRLISFSKQENSQLAH